jgi:uridine phosphorylase
VAKRAWYIGCDESEIADRVLLIGDPGRVSRLAALLDDVHWVKENRGLRTMSGYHRGVRVTASAFGMGGPIATIVLHELANLGARTFLRIGTSMALPPVRLGEFLIASEAIGSDGATLAYGGSEHPAAAAPRLVAALEHAVTVADIPWRKGRFASFDGFYRDMFSLEADTRQRVADVRSDLQRKNVLVTDMESSAIFTAAMALGVEAGSLCVATVDSETQAKIDGEEMDRLERQLFVTALDALADLQPAETA